MKFLAALVLALPLSSFAANYAACDLFKSVYDSNDTLVDSQRVSNTWERLAGKNEIVLEDKVGDASYSATFSLEGYIFASLKTDSTFEIKTWSALNETLRLSVRDKNVI